MSFATLAVLIITIHRIAVCHNEYLESNFLLYWDCQSCS